MSQAHRQSHLALLLPDRLFQKLMEPSKCIKETAQRQQLQRNVLQKLQRNVLQTVTLFIG